MSKHIHHHSSSSYGHGHSHSPHRHHHHVDPPCTDHSVDHLSHSLDLVTTLRSELAASSYKRDRLTSELTEVKSALCAKETECESLRTQTARQSALIGSLQSRLQASETRERNVQARCDTTIQTMQREKRCTDEKNKELMTKIRRLEVDVTNEESHKEQAKVQFHEFIRKLCGCLMIETCEATHLTPDCVLSKASEIVAELQRMRTKVAATCETLGSCENELLNIKSMSSIEKQRLTTQIETMQGHNQELDAKWHQTERDLQITRDRLSECEIMSEKLREELRGFESRCHRLQTTMDRFQNDRLQFLRGLASIVSAPEPCETLIKEKVREIINENQTMHTQLHTLRDQIAADAVRHRESQEAANCRIRGEETQKCALEERLEKANAEIQELRSEHINLSEYLVRLARALCWSECTSPPSHGTDTSILADSLLERCERLATHHEHHLHNCDKNCGDHHHHHSGGHQHHHHHPPGTMKLRREKSCHEIPVKEASNMYTLQRRVRVLREQVQRRDLHLELLRRKLALLEDNTRTKAALQSERDEALNRLRRTTKQVDKLSQQLQEVKSHAGELKAQLSDAAEQKITALERGRKIDELSARVCDLENERTRLLAQIANLKDRVRSTAESSQERRCRDEALINSLRDDINRFKAQLTDANHRLSHLQAFRTSVTRTLHLRDIPETDILHRLHTLCSHQEFTMLSRRYESASPIGDLPCPRFDDLLPPPNPCRPLSGPSPRPHHMHHRHGHSRHFDDASNCTDGFDEEFDFNKKF